MENLVNILVCHLNQWSLYIHTLTFANLQVLLQSPLILEFTMA
jgi:hypothetical protein